VISRCLRNDSSKREKIVVASLSLQP